MIFAEKPASILLNRGQAFSGSGSGVDYGETG
jgi:hypothetical protein